MTGATSAGVGSLVSTDAPGPSSQSPGQLSGRSVLLVINSDEGGGVEQLAAMLANDLESEGARVRTRWLYPSGISSAPVKLMGIAAAAWDVVRSRPDIVMSFQPTSSAVAGIAGRLAGCRARIIHQSNMPGNTSWVPRVLDRIIGATGFYSCNIANSAATAAAFAGYPARYRSLLRRIDHGIAWSPPRRDRAAVLLDYGIPGDEPLIVSCARIVSQKSLHTIVEAMTLLQRGRYVVVGQGPDREHLEQLAATLGVADRIHFLGHVKHRDVFDIYAACDVFAFPSQWETFGLAAVEAAMQGLSVVASDLEVTREVLGAGGEDCATFVAGWDARDWAVAIGAALADPAARSRGRDFAGRIRAYYSDERMLQSYRLLYREMLS